MRTVPHFVCMVGSGIASDDISLGGVLLRQERLHTLQSAVFGTAVIGDRVTTSCVTASGSFLLLCERGGFQLRALQFQAVSIHANLSDWVVTSL